jgi:hypothetical protein
MEVRSQVRQAADILPMDLRAISASGGDIYSGKMLDSAVEFRGTVGSSVVCALPTVGGTTIRIPPKDSLAAGNVLSVWRTTPVPSSAAARAPSTPPAPTRARTPISSRSVPRSRRR